MAPLRSSLDPGFPPIGFPQAAPLIFLLLLLHKGRFLSFVELAYVPSGNSLLSAKPVYADKITSIFKVVTDKLILKIMWGQRTASAMLGRKS